MQYKDIRQVLGTNILVGKKKVPVAHMRYTGSEKTFVVWNILGDTPTLHGDDKPIYTSTSVDVHIYSDKNYVDLLVDIRNRFIDDDWHFVEQSTEMYEEDEKLFHIVLTFEKETCIHG